MRREKSEFDDAMIDYKLVNKEGKCYLFMMMTVKKRKLKKIMI